MQHAEDAVQMRSQAATILRYGGLGLMLAVLLLGPFFQGLFFPLAQHTAQALLSAGFLLWLASRWMTNRLLRPFRGPVEWAGLALLGSYLLASLVTVYPQGHLQVLLQLTSGLLLFYALREEVTDQPTWAPWLTVGLLAAGLGVTLVGLAPHVGLVQPDAGMLDALALVGLETRLSSTFQYPNTFAAYLLVLWVLLTSRCLTIQKSFSGGWRRSLAATLLLIISSAVGYTIFLAFLLAVSRGAVVVLPVGLGLLLLGLPRSQRLVALLFFVGCALPALAAVKGVVGNAALGDVPRVLKWYAAGLAATSLAGAALFIWWRLSRRVQLGLVSAALLIAVVATGWGLQRYGSLAAIAETVLPPQAHRLLDINWQTKGVIVRFIFYKDSLRMLADRPLLGAGGRAWERLYPEYQEFRYVSSEVHGHFLQVGTEAGVPGLLSFGALWAALFFSGWRARKNHGHLSWSLTTAALTLGAHSAIDFDFSYLAVQYLFWALAAAQVGLQASSGRRQAVASPQPEVN